MLKCHVRKRSHDFGISKFNIDQLPTFRKNKISKRRVPCSNEFPLPKSEFSHSLLKRLSVQITCHFSNVLRFQLSKSSSSKISHFRIYKFPNVHFFTFRITISQKTESVKYKVPWLLEHVFLEMFAFSILRFSKKKHDGWDGCVFRVCFMNYTKHKCANIITVAKIPKSQNMRPTSRT